MRDRALRDTILLVGHGSRDDRGNEEVELFAQRWRQLRLNDRIELCSIEFADRLLDQGLDAAADSSDRVIVVPLILGAAGHVKMEIPHHIALARERHPAVTFVMAKHLGAGERVLTALQASLAKAMSALDAPDESNTGVVLLARGSSDRVANGEVAKMARWLFEERGHTMVDVAFTGITSPRVELVVQRQVACGMRQVVVLPYYLYTGVLIERIACQVERLQRQYPTIAFGLADYIGFDDAVYALLDERVADVIGCGSGEATMLECDGCRYREFAEKHGGSHHHHHH
ncbi:MAG: sirohydrochlorin chelatase [Mariprofundales bacterium]|nr:sirohydrochlorin chelatase [Mariprofundales bacterium]